MSQDSRGISPPKKGKTKKRGVLGNQTKVASTSESVEWTCKKCSNTLRDEDGCQALTCDGCNNHYCLSCTSLTQLEFKALSKLQRDDVCWFCANCKPKVHQCFRDSNSNTTNVPDLAEKLDAIVKKISSLESKVDIVYKGQKRQVKLAEEIGEEEAVNDLLSSSETLQNDIHDNPTNESSEEDSNQGPWITVTKRKTKTPALAEILKEALVEQKKVEDEQEKRKHNLIIYNVEEADQSDTRKKQDKEFVESLLKVHLEVDVKVKEMYRLGRKPDTNQKRGRPLKITLENKEDRSIILNRLSKLKNAEDKIRRISVTADLSKDEREKIKELVQEAKNRTQQEVKGEWIHVVRGTYPKLQIVRKKQRKDNKLETKETKEDK
ncbi:hypothetical protein Bbelb_422780 [Branchiostoma belcheri]|nr:hypothetical protein Bbelb_422780 [Branchiostoma belcheri]